MAEQATGANGFKIKELVQIHSRKVILTSAELLALFTTPKTIIEAQGEDTLIEFDSAVVHKPAGTAYSGIAAGEDLAFKYTNASGAQVNTTLETTGFLDQATAQTRITRQIATEYTPVVNSPLVLHMLTGDITTGTSPLVITVFYKVYKNISVQRAE